MFLAGELLQMYRSRAGLTQNQLAKLLILKSSRTIINWEAGYYVPGAEKLQQLIKVYLSRNTFTAGKEKEEARQLWIAVKEQSDSKTNKNNVYPIFDENWFDTVSNQKSLPKEDELLPALPIEYPNNLPSQFTSLVGREEAIARVVEMLREETVRLVTLSGTSGTGKTRLAIEIASELQEDFKHGVFFVPLANSTSLEAVTQAIALVVGIKELRGQSLIASLKQYLKDYNSLLVLDNFEQMVTASSVVMELLEVAPGLKVLVTSREILRIYGEHEFAVPPLTTPDPKKLSEVKVEDFLPPPFKASALLEYEAIRLFVERARSVQPDFELNDNNGLIIAEICTRLDGLPLAIELAAARIRFLSPPTILALLPNSLDLLTGGGRNLPLRQQTLRGAIEWSYNLLDNNEKQLFRRLAVFVGGCTLEAIVAISYHPSTISPSSLENSYSSSVVNFLSPIEVLDKLGSLVDKSLLRQEEKNGSEPRFKMLETLRDYALERATEAGELASLQKEHAFYYLKLAEQADKELQGSQQVEWLERLELEHANLRAALSWAVEPEDRGQRIEDGVSASTTKAFSRRSSSFSNPYPPSSNPHNVALKMGGALWRFWQLHSHLSEGRQWLKQILGASAHRQSSTPNPYLRAKALHGAGLLAYHQGDYQEAVTSLEESLQLFRGLEDKKGVVLALQHLGLVALSQGEPGKASELLKEVLALRRELQDLRGIGLTLNDLGTTARLEGNFEKAGELMSESLRLFKGLGNKEGIALVHRNQGHLAYRSGHLAQAKVYFSESLFLFYELGDKASLASCLEGLAALTALENQPERAVRLWSAAQNLLAVTGAISDPAMGSQYQKAVAEVRQQLPAEQARMIETESRHLPLETVIPYALQQN